MFDSLLVACVIDDRSIDSDDLGTVSRHKSLLESLAITGRVGHITAVNHASSLNPNNPIGSDTDYAPSIVTSAACNEH